MLTDSRHRARSRVLVGVGIVALFLGFAAWAMVSPVSGSPDDDYHLGSIWCPDPVEGGSCEVIVSDGIVTHVVVPETVYKSQHCWAFRPDVSAACADELSDQNMVPSYRFDTGAYPPGFYAFHHLFVGPDVHRSVMIMRLANIALGVGGLLLVGWLLPPQRRRDLMLAATAAWVPMGVYFVASNNPSSWAISGCLIYAAGLVGSAADRDAGGASSGAGGGSWRRWALLALAAGGAGMAMMSRPDSAFFVFVITLGVWLLIPLSRRVLPQFLVSVILAVLGIVSLLSSSQSQSLTGDGGWPVDPNLSIITVFRLNLFSLMDYVGNLWGLGMGPGWMDVPLQGWSTLVMIMVCGGLLFAGASDVSWRKGMATLVLTGALLGIPAVTMSLRHVQPLTYYQGRYMLPLLGVTFLIWLQSRGQRPFRPTRGQLVLLTVLVSVANGLALRMTALRFSMGVNPANGLPAGGDQWWPWSIGFKVLWMGGAGAMAAGIALLLWAVTRQWKPETTALVSLGSKQPTAEGWDINEGDHFGGRLRNAAASADAGNVQAVDAGVRQADDLLSADHTDAGGD